MMKFNIKSALVVIAFIALILGCNNNDKSEGNSAKAILDTVSLSNKRFALAYQDGNKIVATSIDTMKQISFGGATDPAISPDGNKLAYTVNDTAGHRTIWIADMENKSQAQLQVSNDNYYQAVWSPSGNSIAVNVSNDKKIWKIGIIKSDNSGFIILDNSSKANIYSPTWKNEQEIIGQDLVNLYTFNIAGKLINKTAIASLIGNDFSISSSSRFFYSKDGTKLMFNAGKTDKLDGMAGPSEAVYILDIASKKVDRISPKGTNASYLFVTADDRIFYNGAEKPYTQSKIYVSDLKGNSKLIVDKGTNPTGTLK